MSKKNDSPIEYEYEAENEGYAKKIQKLKLELENCLNEKKEYLDGWQRSKADFINAKNGFEDEKKALRARVIEDIAIDLLPIVDSFEMAFKNKESWEKVDSVWSTGVLYIYNQLCTILESHGLKAFEDIGEPFDATRHMSVEVIITKKEGDDGKIVEVLQKGFLLNTQVVRPALVKVAHYEK